MAKPNAADKERGQRLAKARTLAGFPRLVDAERRFGLTSTYAQHERGDRGFGIDDAVLYAKRYNVSLEWLCTGRSDPRGMAWRFAEAFLKLDPKVQATLLKALDLPSIAETEPGPPLDRSSDLGPRHVEEGPNIPRRRSGGAGD